MIKRFFVDNARRIIWRVIGPPLNSGREYVASHGCVRCAASFLAWNQVPGDYLEFGVFEGQSFTETYRSIWRERDEVHRYIEGNEVDEWYNDRPRFFAFDSFEGLPGGPGERHSDYAEGAYACSESHFKNNIKRDGVNIDDVITVPGFYDETLTGETKRRVSLTRVALVLIDCDLYESTVPVLDFITDLVGQGTIIIFDDWYRFRGSRDHGEQRACREWLQRNPQIELTQFWQQGPQSVAFLVHIVSGLNSTERKT